MKTRIVWIGFCLALLLLPAACSKSGPTDKLTAMQIEGVNVEIPQLSAEFANAAPELQSKVNQAVSDVRYRRYVEAMKGLDEVLNSPGLSDKQKTLVTRVLGQLKEVALKAPQ